MAKKSVYIPTNPNKYISLRPKPSIGFGIRCLSSWERKICEMLDHNPNVLRWSSEEIKVAYVNPITGKMSYYLPDFVAEIKGKTGQCQTFMFEVKPHRQAIGKYKTMKEYQMAKVNEAKFKAATNYCRAKGWTFKILTERNCNF